eukprot:gene12399-14551_t
MGKLRFKRQDVSLRSLLSKESLSFLWVRLTMMLGMDYRSLALFRVTMAGCVIGDMIERMGDLFVHYTEEGLMPRHLIVTKYASNYFIPFHIINTSWNFQCFAFCAHIVFAFCMLIGYRTKSMSILTWFLTISLQAYNGVVGHGGDVFFRMMLFICIFLPTTHYFSVDNWYFEERDAGKRMESNNNNKDTSSPHHDVDDDPKEHHDTMIDVVGSTVPLITVKPNSRQSLNDPHRMSTRNIGFASILVILQMSCMYICAYFHKTGEEWKNGEATFYALTLDYFSTDFAKWVINYRGPLALMTIAVAKWELWGSFFLFSPVFTDYCRLFGAIGFMAMHLGFVLGLRLGLFFWVTFFAQTCNIPPFAWDYVLDYADKVILKGQRPTQVYYNTSSPLSLYTTLIMKTFFIIPSTASYAPIESFTDDSISANMTFGDNNEADQQQQQPPKKYVGDDWFVTIDANGVRRRNLSALNYLASKSPLLFGFAYLFNLIPAGIANVFGRILLFSHKKSQEQQVLTKRASVYQVRKYPRRPLGRNWTIILNLWMLFVCYIVLAYNLNNFRINLGWRYEFSQIAFFFRWDQGWNMFSPAPPKTHWWHAIHGDLEDGTQVELFKNNTFHDMGGPINTVVDFEKPIPFDTTYGNHRWFKYWENGFNAYGGDALRLEAGRFICRQFNAKHFGPKMLYRFTRMRAYAATTKESEVWERAPKTVKKIICEHQF